MKLTDEEKSYAVSAIREALDHVLTIYNENPKDWIISTEFQLVDDYILSLHAELGVELTQKKNVTKRQYLCAIVSKYSVTDMICDWRYKKLHFFPDSYGHYRACLDIDELKTLTIRMVSNSREDYPPIIDSRRSSDNELKKLLEDASVSLFGIPKGIFAWRNNNANIGNILDNLHDDTHKLILVDRSETTINKLRAALDVDKLYCYEYGLDFSPFISSKVADEFYQNPDGFIVYRVSSHSSNIPAWLMLIDPNENNVDLASQLATIGSNWHIYYDDVLYENIDTRLWTMADIIEKLNERLKEVEQD